MYKKIKEWIAASDTLHIHLSFEFSVILAAIMVVSGFSHDSVMTIILPPVLVWFIGFFGESFDGWAGTKQEEETGIEGNHFDLGDLKRNTIGCLIAMAVIAMFVL